MSTLYAVVGFAFHNLAPTEEQIEACILNAVRKNQFAIDLHWEGNTMSVDYHPARKYFQGSGWFDNVNADFVAKRLTNKIKCGELTL